MAIENPYQMGGVEGSAMERLRHGQTAACFVFDGGPELVPAMGVRAVKANLKGDLPGAHEARARLALELKVEGPRRDADGGKALNAFGTQQLRNRRGKLEERRAEAEREQAEQPFEDAVETAGAPAGPLPSQSWPQTSQQQSEQATGALADPSQLRRALQTQIDSSDDEFGEEEVVAALADGL